MVLHTQIPSRLEWRGGDINSVSQCTYATTKLDQQQTYGDVIRGGIMRLLLISIIYSCCECSIIISNGLFARRLF